MYRKVMTSFFMPRIVAMGLLAVAGGLVLQGRATGQDDLAQRASWSTPTAEQVKARIDAWLAGQELDELTRAKLDALWPATGAVEGGDGLLEQTATTIALIHEPSRPLVELCQQPRNSVPLPAFEFLADEKTPEFVRNNMRLLYGRWLAQNDLYDEAIEQLQGLDADQVVAPDSLLFYLSAGYHRLLDKEKCLPTLSRLLEREDQIPVRFRTVAQLMAADLAPLKTDTLDEVARLMDDIRRRLDLGRAGARVRKQEDDVIAKLDKMIEELEKQQKGGGGGGGGSLNPSSPAPDSAPLGGKGPGNVDQKNIGSGADWGNLPPKQRQEALQQISRDLPAHYREVIEEYFRKLARDGGS
jgi:hypothetical protein